MEPLFDAFRIHEGLDARVASVARAQHGVISRKQAASAGMSRHQIRLRVDTGRWHQVERGVFMIGGAPIKWRSRLLALCLSFGDEAVVSHLPAGALWHLAGFDPEPAPEATVDRNRSRRNQGYQVHSIGPVQASDRTIVDAIPVTTPTRTLLDCAAQLTAETLEIAVDDAIRRKMTSVSRLRWQLAKGGRRPGVARLRAASMRNSELVESLRRRVVTMRDPSGETSKLV